MNRLLAWRNLVHNKARSLVALAGVVFAVVLILLQLGFLGSVLTTATILYDHMKFDVMLMSPSYIDIRKTGTIPRNRLYQATAVPGVREVEPFYVGFSVWRNPETLQNRGIMVLGSRSPANTFDFPTSDPNFQTLHRPDALMMDLKSRDEFGPREVGTTTELAGKQIRIADHFLMGTGFAADGVVLLSDLGFQRLFPFRQADDISLGLVRVSPGESPTAVAEQLRAVLPADVHVATRSEITGREQWHWVATTSVGTIFGLGVIVAMIVGCAIVYQVLASDISNHRAEYATLKAMGYGRGYLAMVVLQQAILLGALGFLPGVLVAMGLYELTSIVANIPIGMTWGRAVAVFGLTLAMCAISGMLALRKVNSADPADLF